MKKLCLCFDGDLPSKKYKWLGPKSLDTHYIPRSGLFDFTEGLLSIWNKWLPNKIQFQIMILYNFEYYNIYFYARIVKNKINEVKKFLLLDSFVFNSWICIFSCVHKCILFCRVWNSEFHTRKLFRNTYTRSKSLEL